MVAKLPTDENTSPIVFGIFSGKHTGHKKRRILFYG
jgi:hypothetical protein